MTRLVEFPDGRPRRCKIPLKPPVEGRCFRLPGQRHAATRRLFRLGRLTEEEIDQALIENRHEFLPTVPMQSAQSLDPGQRLSRLEILDPHGDPVGYSMPGDPIETASSRLVKTVVEVVETGRHPTQPGKG